MTLIKKPFTPQRTEEERAKDDSRVFTIRLNVFERAEIAEAMRLMQQPKRGTAIKQLVRIGLHNVLHDEKTKAFLGIVVDNQRKNERMGIHDPEPEMKRM